MLPFDVILVILQFADQGTMYEFSLSCQTISLHALKYLWNMPYITNSASFHMLASTLNLQMPLHPYKDWISGLALHFNTIYEAIPDQLFSSLFQLNLEILSLGQLHIHEENVQFKQFLCHHLNQGIAEVHMYGCSSIVLRSLLNAIQEQMRPHLRTLCINQCRLSDHQIIPVVARCPGLKNLKLDKCGCLSDQGLIAIANNCKLLDTLLVTLPPNIIQSNTITTRTLEALEMHCLLLRYFVCGGQIRITGHINQEPTRYYHFAIITNINHFPPLA